MALRKVPFFIAIALSLLVVIVETASSAVLGSDSKAASSLDAPTPGFGILYLALIDGLLFMTALTMGLGLLYERIAGRIQGIVMLIFSFLLLLGSILLIILTLVILLLMVSLLLAVPFGTIAYLALYGHFDKPGAAVTLSIVMFLKLAFAVCLVLSNPAFLKMKGLVLLILTSLLAQIILGFLHGFVPLPLVSITDALGGIVNALLAAIWALVAFILYIVAVVKAANLTKTFA